MSPSSVVTRNADTGPVSGPDLGSFPWEQPRLSRERVESCRQKGPRARLSLTLHPGAERV